MRSRSLSGPLLRRPWRSNIFGRATHQHSGIEFGNCRRNGRHDTEGTLPCESGFREFLPKVRIVRKHSQPPSAFGIDGLLQVRGTLAGAVADDKLLLEQQGFYGDGADAAGAEEFCDGYDKVNRQKEQIAHGSHVITTPVYIHKTPPQGLFALHFPRATAGYILTLSRETARNDAIRCGRFVDLRQDANRWLA